MALRETLEKLIPAEDKLHHFYYGVLLCFLFVFMPWWAVIIINTIIGVGLEVYQKETKTGQFDLLDALWVVIPSMWFSLILNLMLWVPRLF